MSFGVFVDDPADHHIDNIVFRNRCGVYRAYVFAVAHDRYAVGNSAYLVHTVRYVHHTDALGFEIAHYAEQILDFGLGEGGGRFVEDKQFAISRNGFRNLYHLLFSYGKSAEFGFRIDFNTDTVENFLSFSDHSGVVEPGSFF